ncbi:MAG: TolC family protein [Spirochaetaceae bacterium]
MGRRPGSAWLSALIAAAALCGCSGPLVATEPRELAVEEAVALALESNPELRFTRYDRQIAASQYRLGVRSFLPSLSVSYSQNASVSYFNPDSRTRRIAVGVEQLIYDGGRRRYDREMQRLALSFASTSYDHSVEELVLSVVTNYAEMLQLRQQRTILEEIYANALEQLAIAREEVALGESTEIDLLEIALQVKDVEIEADQTARREELVALRFGRLVGLPETILPVARGRINPAYSGSLEETTVETYLARARLESLELVQRRVELDNRREELERVRRRWIPAVSATAEVNVSGKSFPLTEPGFSLGLSLSFAAPVLPAETGVTVGRRGELERSTALTASGRPAENLEEIYSEEVALLAAQRSRQGLLDFESDISFTAREGLLQVEAALSALELLREKAALEERRRTVELLQLEVGEITRVKFVEGEIARARLEVELLASVVGLFRSEVALLGSLGLTGASGDYDELIHRETGG